VVLSEPAIVKSVKFVEAPVGAVDGGEDSLVDAIVNAETEFHPTCTHSSLEFLLSTSLLRVLTRATDVVLP
jgi:hypothetical protein